MGIPSITERKHYRLVPGEAEELTSTIVLTSKDSYFVDVRILKDKYEQEKGRKSHTKECLDWAFAGRCRTAPHGARKDGMIQLSHTVWDHWIDSKSDNAGPDEGDMLVQEDGDVVERGIQKHPVTGEVTEYEELWHDLDVQAFGKKQNRSSLVLRAEDKEKGLRGMAIKIGGWCQGILKIGGALTVERWEWKPSAPTGDDTPESNSTEESATRNGWIRTFRFGEGLLPCNTMCRETSGKFGLNASVHQKLDDDLNPEIKWKVLEEYYW